MSSKVFTLFFSVLFVINALAQKAELVFNYGHTREINSLDYSPDGKYLLSAAGDELVKLWDVAQGKEVVSIIAHTSSVWSVKFSPDGKHFVTAGSDSLVKLWDLHGKLLKVLTGHKSNSVLYAAFANNGKWIASRGFDNTVRLWDVASGKLIRTFSDNPGVVKAVIFSKDDKYLISSGGQSSIGIMDVNTGKLIHQLNGHTDIINDLALSPDGTLLASCSNDGYVFLWDIKTGTLVRKFDPNIYKSIFNNSKEICSIAFSPDGSKIACAHRNYAATIWDVKSNEKFVDIGGFILPVNAIAFSPNGKNVATGCVDKSISIWDANTGVNIRTFSRQYARQTFMQISSDQRYIAAVNSISEFKVFDLNDRMKLRQDEGFGGKVSEFNFSNDAKTVAVAYDDNTTRLIKVNSGEKLLETPANDKSFRSIMFSPDKKYFVTEDRNETIILWEASSGKKFRTIKFDNANIGCYAFSPDSKILACGCNGYGTFMRFIDIATGTEIKSFKLTNSVNSVCFSSDNKYIALCGWDKTVELWDYNSGIILKTFFGHTGVVYTVSFSPDGKYLLSTSSDYTTRLWDVATGSLVQTYPEQTSLVSNAYFINDGKNVLSSSWSNLMIVYDTKTAKILLKLYFVDRSDWVAITPDGRFDASTKGMDYLYYVKGLEILPLESFYEKFYTPNLVARVLEGENFSKPDVDVNDLQPVPLVTFTSPGTGIHVAKPQMTIEVKVTDQGGGIDEIVLYQNGKLIETTTRGFKELSQKGSVQTKTFNVTLSSGENRFKAVAYNKQRTESNPVEIVVIYNVELAKPNLHLFVVGINKYKNPKYTLNFAGADAMAFKEQIEQGGSGIYGIVQTTYIADDQATKTNLLAKMAEVKAKAKKEDVFVFYYAGHGVMSEESKAKYYLALHDVTQLYGNNQMLMDKGISSEELQNISMQIPAQKQLFVIDACQSGGMTEMLASRGAAEEKAIAQLARSTGTFWLAASGTQQFATEFKELGHGVFTYCILQALRGQADSGNADKKITVNEISSFLGDKVPEISEKYNGEAQYPNSYGFGMDFPIVIVK
jgi:WD40 repeat protein